MAAHTPAAAASQSVIEFRGAGYRLPGGPALLSDLNFSVARGETLVLLGRSGSGKTTLLKLVNRLLDPTHGEVRVEGRATAAWDPIRLRRHIGYVIQEAGLFPHFTVARNVGIVPQLEGWPAARIHSRVEELLRLVGLPPEQFAARKPHQLSGGQRQRAGVARALAADPPLLLMDEPFGALDPITRAELQREFRALAARLGKTILFVTHDVREALRLGARIALLAEGRLAALHAAQDFARAPEPEVQALLATMRDGGHEQYAR
ncbi:MAG: ATP-binding cassette domain-containing protein [Candidatus Acidiferrales bacterium]